MDFLYLKSLHLHADTVATKLPWNRRYCYHNNLFGDNRFVAIQEHNSIILKDIIQEIQSLCVSWRSQKKFYPPSDVDSADLARRSSSNDDVLQLAVKTVRMLSLSPPPTHPPSWQVFPLAKCTMFRESGFLAKSTFMIDYPRWDVADGRLIWPL